MDDMHGVHHCTHDIVIIGGGVGGLYVMWRVLQASPQTNVLLLESAAHLGGVMHTVYDTSTGRPQYEATTWRIMPSHLRFLSLMASFDIPVAQLPQVLVRDECAPEELRLAAGFSTDEHPHCFYPTTGFSSLIERLAQALPAERIRLCAHVTDVQQTPEGHYRVLVGDRWIPTRQVVCCCPPHAMDAWSVRPSSEPYEALDYLKVMVYASTPIVYHDLMQYYILSDDVFCRTLSSALDPHWLCLSYVTDARAAELFALWRDFPPWFEAVVREQWHRRFPTTPFPAPNEMRLHFTPQGCYGPIVPPDLCHGPSKETNKAQLFQTVQPHPGLFVVGAHLSDVPRHTEGVLQSADWVLGLLLPSDRSSTLTRPVQSVVSQSNWNVDLREQFRFVLDQGAAASCVANACASLLYAALSKAHFPAFLPSALFLYYNTRVVMGAENEDFGSFYPALIQALDEHGVCPEVLWPSDSNVRTRPSNDCYRAAQELPLRIHVTPIGVEPGTMTHEHILRHLQRYLLGGHAIMVSIARHAHQGITERGQLVTMTRDAHDALPVLVSDAHEGPTHFHSVVLLGMDMEKECFFFLNSYGLCGGDDGIFFLTFRDALEGQVLLLHEMFIIDVTIGHPVVPPDVLSCLAWQANMRPLAAPSHTRRPWRHQPTWISFDHVVVGAGITGSYLAHRLRRKFPTDSILVLDPDLTSSSIYDVRIGDHCHVTSHLYRVHPARTPRHARLLQESGVRPHVPLRTAAADAVSRRVHDAIAAFLGVDDPVHAWTDLETRLQWMNDPLFFSRTAQAFLTEDAGLTAAEQLHFYHHTLCTHPLFFEDMCIFDFFGCCTADLVHDGWFYPAGTDAVYGYLREGFTVCDFGELADANAHIAALSDESALVLCTASCTDVDERAMTVSVGLRGESDRVRIHFRECYLCHCDAGNMREEADRIEMTPKSRSTLVFAWRGDAAASTSPEARDDATPRNMTYHETWGRCFWLAPNLLQCNMTNPGIHRQLRRTRPPFLRDGLLYPVDAWKEMHALVQQHPLHDHEPPTHVMVFRDTSPRLCQRNRSLGTTAASAPCSLWSIMLEQMGVGASVHRLNANLSPQFYFVEGALEMVDVLLDQLRVILS